MADVIAPPGTSARPEADPPVTDSVVTDPAVSDDGADPPRRRSRPRVMSGPRSVLRRHWLAIIAVAACGALAGFGAARMRPTTWTTTASVVVTPVRLNATTSPDAGRAVATEAELVTGDQVVKAVGGELQRAVPKAKVLVRKDTNVLDISASDDSAERATGAANAYARAFTYVRTTEIGAALDAQVKAEEQALETIDGQIAALDQSIGALPIGPSAPAAQVLVAQRNNLDAQRTHHQTQLADAHQRADAAGHPVAVLNEADPPVRPDGVPPAAAALLGAIAGLLLALAVAFALTPEAAP
jgi:uncharacterized protein involved in exopolysaccharide biosynthesis